MTQHMRDLVAALPALERCRVCAAPLDAPILATPAPALTSVATVLSAPTLLYVCSCCGHGQRPDLPDMTTFYNADYRISLQSDEHDQLYAMEGDRPVYRTEHQARLALAAADLAPGARVLDYGAAKAATLKALCAKRPDLAPHVFDVSDAYRPAWEGWIAPEAQASHRLPSDWSGRFDLVAAHFVIEHVAEPVERLREMASLLAPGGRVFFIVPNPVSNSGDLLVVDHVNNFTRSSLERALAEAGLAPVSIDETRYRDAFVVVAEHASQASTDSAPKDGSGAGVSGDVAALIDAADLWSAAEARLADAVAALDGAPCAIYGAGFYGGFIHTRLGPAARPRCFLDRNPHEQGGDKFGLPVLGPDALPPDVSTIFVGLNPARARAIMADWVADIGRPDLTLVFLDRA